MKHVAIVGAGGFTGRELLRWLRQHPQLQPVYISSDRYAGQALGQVFPELEGAFDLRFSAHDSPIPADASVFLATPNETALQMAPALLGEGRRVIDLGGAFRLHDPAAIRRYYKLEPPPAAIMEQCVFGLPEIFAAQIRQARLLANPGCYPTAVIAPLYLLGDLRGKIRALSIDAKSGVSGAGGRSEDGGFVYHNVSENFRAYKVLNHQHEPEIREYAFFGSDCPDLTFTPHLLPCFRGILATTTIFWEDAAPANLVQALAEAAAPFPFLRFRENPEEIELQKVQHTNFVDFSVRSEGRCTVMVSAIDNLVKGAAGQAIQNLNLMLGLPETAGLGGKTTASAGIA